MIGQQIKRALKSAGMSARELAEKLEVHEQSVYRWFRDEPEPAIRDLRKIARLTDKPLYYFLSDSAKGPKPPATLTVTIDGAEVFRVGITKGAAVEVGVEH
jgi:transcriptional regulator with XRE-family HTH domain